jgi:hypothetical protein
VACKDTVKMRALSYKAQGALFTWRELGDDEGAAISNKTLGAWDIREVRRP